MGQVSIGDRVSFAAAATSFRHTPLVSPATAGARAGLCGFERVFCGLYGTFYRIDKIRSNLEIYHLAT